MAADQRFRKQDRQADQQDAENIEYDKGTAAICARFSGESNQIAKPDGRTDRGQDKCGSRGPALSSRCCCACHISFSP